MFMGSDELGSTYQIKFNKSLEHTGRYKGIEDGLNEYVRKETKREFKDSLINVWYRFVDFLKLYF